MDYLLAIDQGTTGTKALLVDTQLSKVAESTLGFKQHYPQPGWVEHDLEEIWTTVLKTTENVFKDKSQNIAAIGITNQRETLCFWDRTTGKPLAPAIVWQDRRTAKICEDLKKDGHEELFKKRTGLLLDPYFSGTKASWAFQKWKEIKKAHQENRLAMGTIDSYLIARLTGNQAHVTEPSNASRTLCFDLQDHCWSLDLCDILQIPSNAWPELKPSVGEFGKTKGVPSLPDGIPITGVLGDQQSALLGQACTEPGMAKCTYGTGAFILMNTGSQPIPSQHKLVTTVAWALNKNDYTYALEGSAFIAGAAVQWVRDGLGIIKDSKDIEALARSVESSDGVTFVPALTGLGAPHWDPHATGMLTGITRGTTPGHIARAVLEGIAFQNADILTAMEKDAGKPLQSLNVDGGACVNDLLMQFQSDVLGVNLNRPVFTETTVLGAVFAAGLGAKIWKDFSEIKKQWKLEKEFQPKISDSERDQTLERWNTAVKRTLLKGP